MLTPHWRIRYIIVSLRDRDILLGYNVQYREAIPAYCQSTAVTVDGDSPHISPHFLTRMSVQAKLTVVGGKASKRTVALRLPTTIGRSRDADLTVAHPQISRKHCELVEAGGLILIRDVGSLNGTYVNSHRVKEAPLPPDATFSIGPLTFRVRYQYEGNPADIPPTIPAEEPPQPPPSGEISETMPVEDESPAEEPAADAEPAAEEKPAANVKPAEEESDEDGDAALDDFLKGLT